MSEKAPICPVCGVPPRPGTTICPDCKEDLAALIQLQNLPLIYYNEGLRLAREGAVDAAIAKLLLAVDHDPALVEPYVVLGRLYAQKGQWQEAAGWWEKALDRQPDHAGAQAGLAKVREQEARRAREARWRKRRQWAFSVAMFLVGVLLVALPLGVWQSWQESSQQGKQTTVIAVVPPTTYGVRGTIQATSTQAPIALSPSLTPTFTPSATAVPTHTPTSTPTFIPTPTPTSTPTPTLTPTPIPDLVNPVQQALHREHPGIDIQVLQEGMGIHLVGTVPTMYLKYQLEATAKQVAGVRWVDVSEVSLAPYTVQPGDTLTTIALKVYGDPSLWHKIAEANRLENPNLILPGQVLVIP